jgi:hypothetical protein
VGVVGLGEELEVQPAAQVVHAVGAEVDGQPLALPVVHGTDQLAVGRTAHDHHVLLAVELLGPQRAGEIERLAVGLGKIHAIEETPGVGPALAVEVGV